MEVTYMKNWIKVAGFASTVAISMLVFQGQASAHGYISKPASRVYLANQGINTNVGSAQWEPQSIEAPKGFPEKGPLDGQIAGGGKYSLLDEQTQNRWSKVDIQSGKTTIEWTLTAPHKTSSWSYYITKNGWDPNKPLTRDQLQLITKIQADGTAPAAKTSQEITIPADHTGYHVILGVWEIADTGNAFYQVIDANISGGSSVPDTEAPTKPAQLETTAQTFNSVSLKWQASTDNKGVSSYEIYRDGKFIGESTTPTYQDTNLAENTTYTYTVRAKDFAGNRSEWSNSIQAKTAVKPAADTEKPTAPKMLMTHAQSSNTIDLCWQAASDNIGVAYYEIYRDGVKIKTQTGVMFQDISLKSDTTYNYLVYAVDTSGNRSDASNLLAAKTKPAEVIPTGTWSSTRIYVAGDMVTYDNQQYRAKWWTLGNKPSESDAWEQIGGGIADWNSTKAYNGGDKVTYNGKTYQAKWWIRGERPDTSIVWVLVK
ncbi:chitin-binding protein [Listeria booriae]|uniref:Chitin-binding protein n=2 Tax=Listeria booriae TaxID=1552123 RepID=A0A842B6X1_9LIST|nr:chitin-binding protein [Listeria booriae]MBC1795080.1 chitin-binding protein [Listeria booriae]MBC1799407.1 chitin-binding protein [Listeria booriae]MBC1810903.1 chitin-binding protein [Listeria booriae]MBC1897362.1 chitin-binding protein [Listeria booriae]